MMAAKAVTTNRWFFLSHQISRDGYGYAGIKILEALLALEAAVEPVDMSDGEERLTLARRQWVLPGNALVLSVPDWLPYVASRQRVCYTMFESTLMPADRATYLNGLADVCLVPCEFCKKSFERQGVAVPILVVPWGVDPGDYWLLERRRNGSEPYRFLWSGTPDLRKGWDLAYQAFRMAFGDDEGAELVLHWRKRPKFMEQRLEIGDRNVRVIEGLFYRPQLRAMLLRADCYVFPARGEGWGLPPREAAATGLPVIATNATGLAHEIDQWALPLRVRDWRPAHFSGWPEGSIGEWAEPDVEHLAERMRWCYENRDEAAAIGQRAADWMAEHATWERTARAIMEVME